MSNQLAQKAKGPGRKRKFDSTSSPPAPASSKQTSSSDENISIATSPQRSGSDDDAMVELDFQSGSVSFHAKRHKLSTAPSTENVMINPTMPAIQSDEVRVGYPGDDLSTATCITRVQCQTPLTTCTSQSCDIIPPMKAPNASFPPLLTPTTSMLKPADDELTRSQSHVGIALPGLLKQSHSSSSEDSISPSTRSNIVCHPTLLSPSNSTYKSSSSNYKEPFCSDEGYAKEDNSGLRFIDDYYSAVDVCQSEKYMYPVGDIHVPKQSAGEDMEYEQSQSLKTSKNSPSLVEQSDRITKCGVAESNQEEVSEAKEPDKSDDSTKTVQEAETSEELLGSKDHSPVKHTLKGRPSLEKFVPLLCDHVEVSDIKLDKSDDSAMTVQKAKTSAEALGSKDHSSVKGTLKRRSAFGEMVPRSVALHTQGAHIGPSQKRRAKARENSVKGPQHPLLKVGKSSTSSSSCSRDKDGMSRNVKRQASKSTRDELMDSDNELVRDDKRRKDVELTDCPSSKELAVKTELMISAEDGMEVHEESSKEHLEHDSMDCSVRKDDDAKEEEDRGGEGSSCDLLPGLPESYSGLQESGLAAIDLFPTDEEFGVETIRRRRALIGADKEGRDSLLKDATRKLSLKAKKRKRRASDKSADGSVISGAGLDEGDDKKQKRVAPNYFVAIQVCSPEIHQSLQNVQQTVMAGDEKLKDAMVPIPTLHLTIMVMHLANDEDIERAKLALMECHRLLGPEIVRKKLNIWFHGLGHFNNQVMFAKIKDIDGILDTLYGVAETVENCYRRHGIHSTGERGFKPHLTVMKLSRAPSLRKKGVRRIKSELYRAHSATLFGNQPVSGFQLCSINKPKSEDGYYFKAHEVLFNGDASPMPDPFDMTGMDGGPQDPMTEPLSSSIIEEEPKEPITEPVSSPVEPSDCQTANQAPESQEAKEVSKSSVPEIRTSPNANREGDKPSASEPT